MIQASDAYVSKTLSSSVNGLSLLSWRKLIYIKAEISKRRFILYSLLKFYIISAECKILHYFCRNFTYTLQNVKYCSVYRLETLLERILEMSCFSLERIIFRTRKAKNTLFLGPKFCENRISA